MTPSRRITHALTAAALAVTAACAGDATSPASPAPAAANLDRAVAASEPGAVYTMDNGTASNRVLAFRRAVDGTLTPLGSYATGGRGTGGAVDPLASQYAVILNASHSLLFAVNAGSNEVSSFRVEEGGALAAADRHDAGGVLPVSLALYGNLLYVLNAGDNSLHGYRVDARGTLTGLPAGRVPLAAGAQGASTVHFSANGRHLLVTERVSSRIESFPVQPSGNLGAPVVTASSGATPFGFDVTRDGVVLVSEAATAPSNGATSSYRLGAGGTLSGVTASLDAGGRATCWVIATSDGRYAYSINSASSTLTGLVVGADGALSLLTPGGPTASAGAGTVPIDPAFSSGDEYLYTLNGASGTIGGFRVGADHGLTAQPAVTAGAPASGLQGLAAY